MYYVLILGGGQGHDYLDYFGGGGPEMDKRWLRDMCTLPIWIWEKLGHLIFGADPPKPPTNPHPFQMFLFWMLP